MIKNNDKGWGFKIIGMNMIKDEKNKKDKGRK